MMRGGWARVRALGAWLKDGLLSDGVCEREEFSWISERLVFIITVEMWFRGHRLRGLTIYSSPP
jgi:hypothetical protein